MSRQGARSGRPILSDRARRVAVFTSTRADLGPLGPVIAAMNDRAGVELLIIASGTHLDQSRGATLKDIEVGDASLAVIDCAISGDRPADLARSMGPLAQGVSDAL